MIDRGALMFTVAAVMRDRVALAARRARAAGFHGVLVVWDPEGLVVYAEPHPRVPFDHVHHQPADERGFWDENGVKYNVECVSGPPHLCE